MKQPKSKFHPSPRLTNEQLDLELKKVKFKDIRQQFSFEKIKDTVWFKQYSRQSKNSLGKILKKVITGINHGKFTYENVSELRGFLSDIKQDLTKSQYNTFANQIKAIENKQKPVIKEEVVKPEKETRKSRAQNLAILKGVSDYEQHEGVNSNRAIAYRKKHNITTRGKENGYTLVKMNKEYRWIKI